jgi:hypothetical protein
MIARPRDHVIDLARDDRHGDPVRVGRAAIRPPIEVAALHAARPFVVARGSRPVRRAVIPR